MPIFEKYIFNLTNPMMSADEFDLLDELYFLQSYEQLKKELDWDDRKLLATLQALLEKGWIKCYSSPEEEVLHNIQIDKEGENYLYLATKEGLLEHNQK